MTEASFDVGTWLARIAAAAHRERKRSGGSALVYVAPERPPKGVKVKHVSFAADRLEFKYVMRQKRRPRPR